MLQSDPSRSTTCAQTAASAEFHALRAHIRAAMPARFGDVEVAVGYDLPAFQVRLPRPPARAEVPATSPHRHSSACPRLKKAGRPGHVWHRRVPTLLHDHAPWRKDAGFKPMVGCVPWNRKASLPMAAFERLLDAAKQAM